MENVSPAVISLSQLYDDTVIDQTECFLSENILCCINHTQDN
jgi:hypothetical protein